MAHISDRMSYLVIAEGYVPEQNVSEMDRKTVVKDIADAQYDGVLQVLELNPVEGICRDVTEDIAREIMEAWAYENEPLKDWQYEFVELHVSTQAANEFRRAA